MLEATFGPMSSISIRDLKEALARASGFTNALARALEVASPTSSIPRAYNSFSKETFFATSIASMSLWQDFVPKPSNFLMVSE